MNSRQCTRDKTVRNTNDAETIFTLVYGATHLLYTLFQLRWLTFSIYSFRESGPKISKIRENLWKISHDCQILA